MPGPGAISAPYNFVYQLYVLSDKTLPELRAGRTCGRPVTCILEWPYAQIMQCTTRTHAYDVLQTSNTMGIHGGMQLNLATSLMRVL
jgi:hypothetical protein